MKYRPDFPERFGSLMDARSWGREFFLWYNEEHYHTGLGLLTPQMVHYGAAETVQSSRQQVLHTAYAVHPERFVRGVPSVLELPKAVWINKPAEAEELLGEAEELLADVQGSNSRIEQARY